MRKNRNRDGLIVSAPDSVAKGQWFQGCWARGQDNLLSLCLSPPRSRNGYQQTVRETEEELECNLRWTNPLNPGKVQFVAISPVARINSTSSLSRLYTDEGEDKKAQTSKSTFAGFKMFQYSFLRATPKTFKRLLSRLSFVEST